jgi:hypothetical protein
MWASISGGVATNGIQGFRGSKALYFAGSGSRNAVTIPLDVSMGGTIQFLIRAGNEAADGNLLWNNSEVGENVLLEYSKDGGDWFAFQTNNTIYPSLSSWATFSIAIPAAAASPNTQFRWRQLANSGPGFDCWALEDIKIQAVAPNPPAAVPFVISSASSSSAIAVFWIGASGAGYYVVERKAGIDPWTQVAMVSSITTYYTDTGLLPDTPYSYRITAVNAGGSAAPSATTTSFTWSQMQQWIADNYGSPDALTSAQMTTPGPDGIAPLLRFAFNLAVDEPLHPLQPGGSSGVPSIWVDSVRHRLSVEFVRRKQSLNPGISYAAEFSANLSGWMASGALINTTSIDAVWERVRYEDFITQDRARARFCRVGIYK